MVDPRIQRTRIHVLETARRLLSDTSTGPLTFTLLAKEAQVSRRTLYAHWGTVEKVISEAVTLQHVEDATDTSAFSTRQRLEHFLNGMRSGIHEPVASVALASLMHQAVREESAGESLVDMGDARIEQFREQVGPITSDQYAQLVGPIFISEFMMRTPASDELIQELVERGLEILDTDVAISA